MTNTIHEVSILGLGAMGALYVAAFEDAGFNVRVIATGERADRIERDGFALNETHYTPAVARPGDGGIPADLIIIGVKQHHLLGTLDDLAPFVGKHTQMISLINGLNSEPMLIERFSDANVLYCSTVGMTPVREGNKIRSTNRGKLIFGEARNEPPSERVQRVMAAFDTSGIPYEVPADMMRQLWWKLMANVAVNQTSSVLRMPYGVLRTSDHARHLMDALGGEVITLAGAVGVDLKRQDLLDFYEVLGGVDPCGKTSMLQDVEAGRTNEVEIFAGTIVTLGEKHGVPTPMNAVFAEILRALNE